MKKKGNKQRIALTLLLSGFIFVVNIAVLVLTIAVIYALAQIGVIKTTGGQVGFPNVLKFMFYTSIIIGALLANISGKLPFIQFYRIIEQLDRLANGDYATRLHFGKPLGEHPAFHQIETSFNRAAEELEHTEKLRNDFINNFSHEFKTPIVSIAGFAKLLRKGNLTEKQKEEYLAVIEEESLRLSAMATSVLNLTKVENQTILTNVTKFNLSEQIRGAALLLVDKWTSKNLYLDMQFAEYSIYANKELLKQVWINLLDNAIKFSEVNGMVTVGIAEHGNGYRVSISNRGIEIPEESIPHIFNKFYQADESHSSEGSGIGLAVVKKVCDLHGGKVSVESNDGITTFAVQLPKEQQLYI